MSEETPVLVTITATMNEDVAWQLAQFCKRSTFNEFYDRTEEHLPREERTKRAYHMIAGIDAIAAALEREGHKPR